MKGHLGRENWEMNASWTAGQALILSWPNPAPQQGQQVNHHQGKNPYFCPSACRKVTCRFIENYFSDSQAFQCQNSRCFVHWVGGEEANLGFVNLWIPGTLLLSWQSWENQFLSGKIIPAPAIFQVNQKGLSMFSTGSSSPVPLVVPAQTGIARNNSLIPHLFGSRDCHTLFISGDD